jgi:hypothetical protein
MRRRGAKQTPSLGFRVYGYMNDSRIAILVLANVVHMGIA